MMRKRLNFEDDEMRKFSIGETVFSKDNTQVKMTIIRFSGKCYFCAMHNSNTSQEIMYFEEDLINEWQIPFF